MASLESILATHRMDQRSGPCDDDMEATTRMAWYLPEESEHEGGSPLSFRGYRPETSYQYDRNVRYERRISMEYDSRLE